MILVIVLPVLVKALSGVKRSQSQAQITLTQGCNSSFRRACSFLSYAHREGTPRLRSPKQTRFIVGLVKVMCYITKKQRISLMQNNTAGLTEGLT